MAFIIFQHMHSFHTQRFMQKSLLSASRSLTIKDHTLTRLRLMCSFTINLTNHLTFPVMILIPCSFSHLRISIHPHHTIDHFKPITNTEFQNKLSNHWIISMHYSITLYTSYQTIKNHKLKTELKFKSWNITLNYKMY